MKCPKCNGEGWLWWNELDDYNGLAIETGQDDNQYSCDNCDGSGEQTTVVNKDN